MRPGEKLYEELLIGDNVVATPHPMIMSANEDHLLWDVLKARLTELLAAIEHDDYARVRQLLRDTVNGYAPDGIRRLGLSTATSRALIVTYL